MDGEVGERAGRPIDTNNFIPVEKRSAAVALKGRKTEVALGGGHKPRSNTHAPY